MAEILRNSATKADVAEVKNIADETREAVKTLEGLNNADESIKTLAGQIVQIQENTKDIKAIKETKVYLTQSEFDKLREAGELDESKEYNTYEE